jgi:hypothetical protein
MQKAPPAFHIRYRNQSPMLFCKKGAKTKEILTLQDWRSELSVEGRNKAALLHFMLEYLHENSFMERKWYKSGAQKGFI